MIAAGYAQSMMNVPTPVNHPNAANNGNNMRPPQPNVANNFQNANRNWTPGFQNVNTMNNNNANQKRPGLGFNQQAFKNRRPAQQAPNAVKPQVAFYCEICKISCAGAQTYKEHTEGQKHKKREQALKINELQLQQQQAQAAQEAGQVQPTQTTATATATAPTLSTEAAPKVTVTATTLNRNIHTVRCELCDVACSGRDSYLSHIRGSKHLKTLKLHKKLGKPIPADFLDDPPSTATAAQPQPTTKTLNESSTSTSPNAAAAAVTQQPTAPAPAKPDETSVANGTSQNDAASKSKLLLDEESAAEPVGKEYVETRVEGKAVSFYCKLCDCQFNDPNAKEMHTKGRRHRLSYKKKVDPSLIVDLKSSRDNRTKQLQQRDPRLKRNETAEQPGNTTSLTNMSGPIQPLMSSDIMMTQPTNVAPVSVAPNHAPLQQLMSQPLGSSRLASPMSLVTLSPRAGESFDDRHVIAKHCAIHPSELEMSKIQEIVSNSEKALKLVSDQIAEEDHAKSLEPVKTESETTTTTTTTTATSPAVTQTKKDDIQAFRALKGVMRVGLFSKNLMLKDDTDVQLVVLCAKKPTKSLLSRVHQILIKKIEVIPASLSRTVRVSVH